MIKKEIDEIIMENPGPICTGKDQKPKAGISDPRNKALMKMFNMIDNTDYTILKISLAKNKR